MSAEATKKKQGFVLLGFPRSGTTLLSRLLDAHPDVSAPPETYLMSAAARFLHQQSQVEGPPIGVVSGLNFLGFDAEQVMEPLRDMVFDFHARIAGKAPVWIEKTAIDVFHLETLEEFLDGHVRFIVIERNPLDVIASNLKLAGVMGAQLDDLFALTRETNSPHEGLAKAWVDRAHSLRSFSERRDADVCRVRYEDLTLAPAETLAGIFEFIGLDADPEAILHAAFESEPRFGLGDFNFDQTTGVVAPKKNSWRGKIPPAALSRILPILAPEMEMAGYPLPKAPPIPSREDAVRQFKMAAAFKRNASRNKE